MPSRSQPPCALDDALGLLHLRSVPWQEITEIGQCDGKVLLEIGLRKRVNNIGVHACQRIGMGKHEPRGISLALRPDHLYLPKRISGGKPWKISISPLLAQALGAFFAPKPPQRAGFAQSYLNRNAIPPRVFILLESW